ncbi:hypothetical protein BU26DRAFT_515390 [Trematosphaeria pertusa]|uniref:Uncharacterized protein n=1 Tax=Trematosphaeria pertusa TaxID=390896 RepID=A0A6A6IRC0_9PLEO|nr:uncharacterized protein BU26DRAFT_515390 [Trematosphaeria pertusa]KAF2253011.1 hypothetical protein BU26DRAFT_515390 [Trematosphaeria pertusa]
MASTTATTAAPDPPSSTSTTQPPDATEPRTVTEDVSSSPPTSIRPSLSWKSFRSSITLSEKASSHLGWAIAFLSVLFTIVALSPAFKSQDTSEKSLRLAEWTALKDYIEECREELAAGIQSQACLRAMKAKLPPPPYVKPGILDRMRRGLLQEHYGKHNGTSRGMQVKQEELHIPRVVQGIVFLGILLTACVFLFLSFESTRSRIRRQSHPLDAYGQVEKLVHEGEIATTTICQPPSPAEGSLRRRAVRTHPIYQRSSLGSAIHHEDMAEIRMRLRNGEDVNQHWSYLIYKLAITPSTAVTGKQLEIAQLFLDFGADVNALKGWNGQSALMIAIHFGNLDVAKLLIANGATVWYSPPLIASEKHHYTNFSSMHGFKGTTPLA